MTACRVFMVGEGPTDIGDLAHDRAYRNAEDPREGFLQPVVRNLVGPDLELEFFDGRKLVHLPVGGKNQPPHKLQARKAAQALALATELDADALVFACDVDKAHGTATKIERRKRLRELRKSIHDGFEYARREDLEAQQVATAIAVPARTIEAWALGDRTALAELLEVDVSTLTHAEPEELWGNGGDPASNHPKSVWNRVTDRRIGFSVIGEAADPEVLRESCPDSFGAFAEDVDQAVEHCPHLHTEKRSPKQGRRRR
jgi:hypothetical protein